MPAAAHGDALVAIDKLDKIGREGVARNSSARRVGRGRRALLDFLDAIRARAAHAQRRSSSGWTFVAGHEAGRRGLANCATCSSLAAGDAGRRALRIDPSLARGLSYYTGAIMEVAVPDLAGSLGGGGRYDNLVGMFLGRDVPACGFSLGLERILVVMTERDMFPPSLATRRPTSWSRCGATAARPTRWRSARDCARRGCV